MVCTPQYTLFLLYASFAHSARLQELLLGRCESSVHTAHTIYWFLRAFCLQGARVTPVGVKAIEQVRARRARAFNEGRHAKGAKRARWLALPGFYLQQRNMLSRGAHLKVS